MMSDDPLFLLIDGHNIAYRSYFAIRNLTRSDGTAVNAVYGFIRTVESLKRKWKPTHWCAAFDGGLPEERLALLEEYKAQRPEMPEELSHQLDWIEQYCRAARMACLRMEAREADDIIATLARRAEADGADAYIVSGDKDLMQLVGERIRMINPAKPDETVDAAAVRDKTGVQPEQIVDWLALTGDTSDNIPGLAGVGPKTAARWLHEFETLDGVLAHADDVQPPRFADVLAAQRDLLERNRMLVRLDDDVPLERAWSGMTVDGPDVGALLALYDKMEFKRMADDLRNPSLL